MRFAIKYIIRGLVLLSFALGRSFFTLSIFSGSLFAISGNSVCGSCLVFFKSTLEYANLGYGKTVESGVPRGSLESKLGSGIVGNGVVNILNGVLDDFIELAAEELIVNLHVVLLGSGYLSVVDKPCSEVSYRFALDVNADGIAHGNALRKLKGNQGSAGDGYAIALSPCKGCVVSFNKLV